MLAVFLGSRWGSGNVEETRGVTYSGSPTGLGSVVVTCSVDETVTHKEGERVRVPFLTVLLLV